MTGYSFSTPVWDGSTWVTPVVAEVAATARQHAGQRAAGDAAQRRAQDRRDRRGGRADLRGQGAGGGAGAPVHLVMESPRGQARVHTEGIKPCEAEAARDPR